MDISALKNRTKLKKGHFKLGINQKKILLLLLGGMALACARSAKKQWKIMKGLSEAWKELTKQAAERAVEALYESRLIEAKENPDHTFTFVLSEKGKNRALTYRLHHMHLKPQATWDKKWRIVLYDIPEDEREARDAFRNHLKELGLRKFQHSAGITPLECKDELDFIIELLDIRKYVRYIVAEHVDNEPYWRHIFQLNGKGASARSIQ